MAPRNTENITRDTYQTSNPESGFIEDNQASKFKTRSIEIEDKL